MQTPDRRTLEQLSRAEQTRLGLPDGWKTYSPAPFAGLNQKDSRFYIGDQELWWLENFFRLGNGLLRPIDDVGTSRYTAPAGKTILSFFFFALNAVQYVAMFHTDGTANQVNLATNAVTAMSATPGTFYQTGAGQPPACAQWGSRLLLISNNFDQNNYWAWDGSLLYGAGTISPIVAITNGGQTYSSVPSYTVIGGSGTPPTFSFTIDNGSLVAAAVTSPGSGYLPTDFGQVQVLFSGGGSDTSAHLQAVLNDTSLQSIIVNAEGSGYGGGTTVVITPALGGATAAATIVGGRITAITVVDPGTGYTTAPMISFANTGGGAGALATATLVHQGIAAVSVISGGTNYVGIPTLSFVPAIGQVGSTIATAATAIMSGPGPIITAEVTGSGAGYDFVPTVTISDPTGSGASILPILSNGALTGLTVVNGGENYSGPPTLTIQAPIVTGGVQATGSAFIGGGSIASVNVTNFGGGYQSAPAVIVQSTNNAAALTLQLMPFEISGSAIENYTSRVFLISPFTMGPFSNGGTYEISAPESMSDFATSAGGDIVPTTDASLRVQFVNVKQSTGNLYFIGDSSTSVLSNINTAASGTPAVVTTTFTYQNMDPQIGAGWRDTFQPFSRTIVFSNPLGVWGLYGGADTKVSEKLDSLFAAALAVPNPLVPSSAVVSLHSQRVYLLLKTIIDPRTSAQRNVLLGWNEKEWFVFSQSANLTYIGTQEVNTLLSAWGTDGTNLFPLFNQSSATLVKSFSTKIWGIERNYITKLARAWFISASDRSTSQNGINFNLTIDTEIGSFQVLVPNGGGSEFLITNPYPQAAVALGPSGDVYAGQMGMSFTSTSPDFELYSLSLGYTEQTAIAGDM